MNKEALERIKQAYYSGLKVQIWFNGYWENFDARDYSMYSDPFSENRQYRIVGSAYADIAEKRIAEQEELLNSTLEENKEIYKKMADLDTALEDCTESLTDARIKIKELEKENAELKEINEGYCRNIDRLVSIGLPTFMSCKETVNKLKEAKDLIRNLLRVTYGEGWNYSLDVKVKAEDFLGGEK